MRTLPILAAFLVAVIAGGAARADAPAPSWVVSPTESAVRFHLVHKLHEVTGQSRKVEGAARVTAQQAMVQVRVPSVSFDSSNVNRDEHMKETIEAAKFPWVELKALAPSLPLPPSFPGKTTQTWKAQITFHGVSQVIEIPVELAWQSATKLRAHASFPISLEGFHVERPSLFLVKVDDAVRIEADVVFEAKP